MQKKINWLAEILLLYVYGARVHIFVLCSAGGERSHFYSCLRHSTVHPRVFLQQEIKYENHQKYLQKYRYFGREIQIAFWAA